MTSRPLRRLERKPVLRAEDLDAAILQLRTDLAEAGARLAQETAAPPDDDRPRVAVPDLSGVAEQALRDLLEEETVALVEPDDGNRGIAEYEFHRELLKKALVGLKTPVLRDLARSRGLEPEGRLDELARQVAASYQWDEQAIARLILDYAEDPRETEGGPTTRIFALTAPINLAHVEDRLSYVDGRYYRTDIAKWFTFGHHQRVGSVLKVAGTLQTYRADVDPADEDRLKAERDVTRASLDAADGSRTVRVHDATNAAAARSMIAAFNVATSTKALPHIPNTGSGADIRPRTLHPSTEFLLDLVSHRLRGHLFRQRDVVLARFRYTRTERAVSDSDAGEPDRKPSLAAVRFEGRNLLDSTTAIGLMWTEGRPLVDLTIRVAVTSPDADRTVLTRLPVRIALEKDHILVSSGLSTSPDLMADVHRAVLRHVEAAIAEPIPTERRAQLEQTVRNRAQNADPDADAELFGDDDDLD
ncbi:MAG: hypothetical protein JWN57_2708 [Frankiales bacterium]|jgi:hypothetical protein|nr:hypothetical protein [Frankiales bacterium]